MSEFEKPTQEEADEIILQWKLETMASIPKFDELFEFATETCLTNPDLVDELTVRRVVDKHNTTKNLIKKFGYWGLRSAVEHTQHAFLFDSPGDEEDTQLYASDLLPVPQIASTERDDVVVHKIEAFGRALLEEAFAVLGPDTMDKVIEYQEATTVKDRVEIIAWVVNRIADMRDIAQARRLEPYQEAVNNLVEVFNTELSDYRDNEDALNNEAEMLRVINLTQTLQNDVPIETPDNNDYFHPAHLSPKLMGVYPDIQLGPTCLSVSILLASFLEKAGVSYFHAGVMDSAFEIGHQILANSITRILDLDNEDGFTLPDPVAHKLTDIYDQLQAKLMRNRGHHAAVLVQLGPEKWLQVDPNYGVFTRFYRDEEERLEVLYQLHEEMWAMSPGFESADMFEEGYHAAIISDDLETAKQAYFDKNWGLLAFNMMLNARQPLDMLRDLMLLPLTIRPGDNEEYSISDEIFNKYLGKRYGFTWRDKISFIDNIIDDVIFKYIFPDAIDGDITKSIERCSKDESYRQRRFEDFRIASMLVVYNFQHNFVEAIPNINLGNGALELGLPHYRIGASVLSDFAVYGGDGLPPSFWATYWPSHAVFTDHMVGRVLNENQEDFVLNMVDIIKTSGLRYRNFDGILALFHEQEGETDNVGDSER